MKRLNNQAIADTFSDPATYPVGRGFERHYGVIWGVVNFFDPFSLVDGTTPVREVPPDYYITDALSDRAVQYIDDFKTDAKGGKPFFLYVAHVAPHWPLHAPKEDVDANVEHVSRRVGRRARCASPADEGTGPAAAGGAAPRRRGGRPRGTTTRRATGTPARWPPTPRW